MSHEQRWPSCKICAKSVYPTWRDAKRAARDMMRLSNKSVAIEPYRSRPCNAIHLGKATGKTKRRNRRNA